MLESTVPVPSARVQPASLICLIAHDGGTPAE